LKSFIQYINEEEYYSFIEDLAKQIILDLKGSNNSSKYSLIKEYEFLEPKTFDLKLVARWDSQPDFSSDRHFKQLTWEEHNFTKNGYSINAIKKFDNDQYRIPEIDVFIIINGHNQNVYNILYPRLVGIISHELRHAKQMGINKEPFMGRVSTKSERSSAQQDYKYFLLPEELDAMVEDKYIQAKAEGRPVDMVMMSYLYPFIKDGFMTEEEFKRVYSIWIKRAIELFPDANFSNKVQKIINTI